MDPKIVIEGLVIVVVTLTISFLMENNYNDPSIAEIIKLLKKYLTKWIQIRNIRIREELLRSASLQQ